MIDDADVKIETIIKDIINEYLENKILDSRGYGEDIFERGLSSLNYVRVIVKIEERLNIEFSDEYLFSGKLKCIEDFIFYCNKLLESE